MNSVYRFIFSLFFLGILVPSRAQTTKPAASFDYFPTLQNHPLYPFFESSVHSSVEINAEGQAASNYFDKGLLLTGLNNEVADRNSNRIKGNVRGGGGYAFSVRYTNKAKELSDGLKRQWYAEAGSQRVGGLAAGEDAAHWVLDGNSDYAGKIADLSGSRLNVIEYNHLQFGLVHVFSEGNKLISGISLLQGVSNYSGAVATASLYTQPEGESIGGPIDATWTFTERSDKYFDPVQLGAAINASYSGKIGTNLFLGFHLKDVGLIAFKDGANGTIDSTVDYSGFTYVFKGGESRGFDLIDSLSKGRVVHDTFNYIALSPASMELTLGSRIREGQFLQVSAQHRLLPGFIPRLEVQYQWFLSPRIALFSGIGYGGFGQFQWNEEIHLRLSDRLGAAVEVRGIEGLLIEQLPMNSFVAFRSVFLID